MAVELFPRMTPCVKKILLSVECILSLRLFSGADNRMGVYIFPEVSIFLSASCEPWNQNLFSFFYIAVPTRRIHIWRWWLAILCCTTISQCDYICLRIETLKWFNALAKHDKTPCFFHYHFSFFWWLFIKPNATHCSILYWHCSWSYLTLIFLANIFSVTPGIMKGITVS